MFNERQIPLSEPPLDIVYGSHPRYLVHL